ncbi:hypothetical protein [Evansella cellulosilytica]|uniref:hypothetical protein n=1 Tax=Evansella cellulosilytica TaxID=1413 RepID=UPI0001C287DA|nr:hypothetical protein [Evansella cellulosilytica]
MITYVFINPRRCPSDVPLYTSCVLPYDKPYTSPITEYRTHIKDLMKEMHVRYTMWFNRKHGYDGHLFQGRYGAKLIDTDLMRPE